MIPTKISGLFQTLKNYVNKLCCMYLTFYVIMSNVGVLSSTVVSMLVVSRAKRNAFVQFYECVVNYMYLFIFL